MNLKTWRKMTKEERRQALSEMPATEKKDLSKKNYASAQQTS